MKEILKEESLYLDKTKTVLNKLISLNDEYINKRKKDTLNVKNDLWENRGEFADFEIILSLNRIDESTDLINNLIKKNEMYKKELDNPYFARVDFKIDDETTKVYLGYTNVYDNDYYVYDWRAPIADLYYNYIGIGKSNYKSPSGIVEGETTLRRQIKVENGNLIRAFDSDVNIDDEYLQNILNTNSSDRMKNIVSSIQIEQNKIIRNLNDKVLIVQGIAGSGKTSVALHRISYLLYNNKELNSNNVLILSPNNEFSDYISEVLPSLGEKNVNTFIYDDFLSKKLKLKSIISSKEIINNIIDNKYDSLYLNRIKYLMSEELFKDITAFLDNFKKNIIFKDNIKIGSSCVNHLFLNSLLEQYKEKNDISKAIDIVSEKVTSNCRLPKTKYKKKIKDALINLLHFDKTYLDIYNDFINSYYFGKSINYEIDRSKVDKEITFYDAIICLLIKIEVFGIEDDSYIKSLVIDEAQDYSLLQIEILKRIYKNADFTILGDINQCIYNFNNIDSIKEFSNLFEKSAYYELKKSYRSTEEIVEYSNNILNIKNISALHHSIGLPVKETNTESINLKEYIKSSIDNLKEKGLDRFLFIVGTKELETKYKRILKDIDNLEVLCVYYAKGLEYDGVFVLKDETINNKLFYISATRAQKYLEILF